MNEQPLTVLCVDDEADHAELLRCALESLDNISIEFHTCRTSAEAVSRVREQPYDAVFLDYRLGPETGLDVLRSLREEGVDIPIIMLTAHGDEYVAIEVTRAGADAYLVKSDIDAENLGRAISGARQRARERVEASRLHDRIDRLESLSRTLAESNLEIAMNARIDPLTDVLNRRAWEETAAIEHERSLRHHHAYAIVLIDVDHFKRFNDTVGHQAGDRCLQHVVQCLGGGCRGTDVVGRYGGEEFVVLLPETTLPQARIAALRIMDAVRARPLLHPGLDDGACVTISLGVAEGPGTAGWQKVVEAADRALYMAKAEGRDRMCAATPEAA